MHQNKLNIESFLLGAGLTLEANASLLFEAFYEGEIDRSVFGTAIQQLIERTVECTAHEDAISVWLGKHRKKPGALDLRDIRDVERYNEVRRRVFDSVPDFDVFSKPATGAARVETDG